MVMQVAADFLVGGSNPGVARSGATALNRIRTADRKFCDRVCDHSTGGGVTAICLPTAWSLLSENF